MIIIGACKIENEVETANPSVVPFVSSKTCAPFPDVSERISAPGTKIFVQLHERFGCVGHKVYLAEVGTNDIIKQDCKDLPKEGLHDGFKT